jgi:hypothetical protein
MLLHRVEVECRKVGLRLNSKKITDILKYIIGSSEVKSLDGTVLSTVEDFK